MQYTHFIYNKIKNNLEKIIKQIKFFFIFNNKYKIKRWFTPIFPILYRFTPLRSFTKFKRIKKKLKFFLKVIPFFFLTMDRRIKHLIVSKRYIKFLKRLVKRLLRYIKRIPRIKVIKLRKIILKRKRRCKLIIKVIIALIISIRICYILLFKASTKIIYLCLPLLLYYRRRTSQFFFNKIVGPNLRQKIKNRY